MRVSKLFAMILFLVLFTGYAQAQAGLTLPGANFTGNSGLNLTKTDFQGTQTWACNMGVAGVIGASVGGSPARATTGTVTSGTMAAVGNCPQLTLDQFTFQIKTKTATGGTGVAKGMTFKQNGFSFCSTTADVPFTWSNDNAGGSTMSFDTAFANCYIQTALKICPNVDVVQ